MKNIFKLAVTTLILFGAMTTVQASELNKLIKSSPLDKTSVVAISVKEAETGKSVFEYNESKLLHPASTLKVFTAFPALDALGEDYNFQTTFYEYKNDLYIKLGADPFLNSQNLKDIAKLIKAQGYKNFKNVYFDDSIMDNVEWGIGWMWDDGTNPLMQKFSAYNLDDNLASITVSKDASGIPTVSTSSLYSMPVLNNLKAGDSNSIYAVRHDWASPDIICLTGTVAGGATVRVPINNMRHYFEKRLFNYFDRSKIKVENQMTMVKQVPSGAKKIAEVKNPATATLGSILKSSDNKTAETLAKVAGGVKYEKRADLSSQIKVFYEYWAKNKVDTTGIMIADACGVSRNNLVSVDFMTNALNSLYKVKGADYMKSVLAQPGEGTLSERMLNHRGSLYLKTGTLANISGLTGYVVADNGKTYSVAILIQNFAYPMVQVKAFENQIIEDIKKL